MIENEIIQWSFETLLLQGYKLKNTPEAVQDTPWSYVVRFMTSDGYIYLKHTPKLLALEASITQILHDEFHASVPEIIANNTELNCFLMKDAGKPLREILKLKFDVTLLSIAIDEFTTLQVAVSDHVDVFLNMGVPDWRLDKLPALYQNLLEQKEVLLADGLSEMELRELEQLYSHVCDLCKQLSGYGIKQSLVQCDFHDNNILINDYTQKLTFIDLGEIVISHPFFSLVGFLRQTKKHHAVTDEDEVYQLLMRACFKNHLPFASERDLLEAFATSQKLWIIYEALAQYRLRLACDQDRFIAFQRHGKLRDALREFLMIHHKISFKPLQENDLELLCHWLDQPHVNEWWNDGLTHDEIKQKYRARIGDSMVLSFIVYIDNQPIGFIQYYHADQVGDGWWPDEVAGTVGIDQFIGDLNYINRGYGTQMIIAFIRMLFENQSIKKIITDVDQQNKRALRCYEKVGFKLLREEMTPDGLAVVMELNKADISTTIDMEPPPDYFGVFE